MQKNNWFIFCRLLGSPKRELREYVPYHFEAPRIPSACATGFKGIVLLLGIVAALIVSDVAEAQRPRRQRGEAAQGQADGTKPGEGGNYAAFQLLRKGQELLDAGEHDRGAKILETIVEQYPADPIRFRAYLALGKHALSRSQQMDAIGYLRNLKALEQPGMTPSPNIDPGLVRESSCPWRGWKGFSDEEATQCRADRGPASAG